MLDRLTGKDAVSARQLSLETGLPQLRLTIRHLNLTLEGRERRWIPFTNRVFGHEELKARGGGFQ